MDCTQRLLTASLFLCQYSPLPVSLTHGHQRVQTSGCMICARTAFVRTVVKNLSYLFSLLERGHMFVFSKLHLRKLISRAQFERDRTSSTLLDIGAGDGRVTQQFGEFATSVCVTEASVLMRRALQRKNFR